MELDKHDIAILGVLQKSGRISNKELAERVGLSPAPCWRRLRELEKSGVIRDYVALLEPKNVNLNIIAFAHVSLENHHARTVSEFDRVIQGMPEVLECYMTSGNYDYMLKVVSTDMAAYERFLSNFLLQLTAVRNVSTSFVLHNKKLITALPLENDATTDKH